MTKETNKCEECGTPMYLSHGMLWKCMDDDCSTNQAIREFHGVTTEELIDRKAESAVWLQRHFDATIAIEKELARRATVTESYSSTPATRRIVARS